MKHLARVLLYGLAILLLLILAVLLRQEHHRKSGPALRPAELAAWPWREAAAEARLPGVTYWTATAYGEGHAAHLIEFDFAARPSLRLELYDHDQDDATPFDNHADCRRGVAGVVRHLQSTDRGPILAAWNGLFYSLAADGLGSHIAPVVLDGEVHYNVGNHRWSVGVAYHGGAPSFGLLHLPDKASLAQFDFAAAGAQALVKDGQPLRLLPQPQDGDPPLPRPYPSTPQDAGPIPDIDYLCVSRTSMGWSADSSTLWLLVIRDLRSPHDTYLRGGWTLEDLQRFWIGFGAANAVNLDGGPETQMLCRKGDGWLLVPSGKSLAGPRMDLDPSLEYDAGGGSLMTFYVRDTAEGTP